MHDGPILLYTKFTDLEDKGYEMETAFGYFISNGRDMYYYNVFETFHDLKRMINEDTVFHFLKERHPSIMYLVEEAHGLNFNGRWLEYKVKPKMPAFMREENFEIPDFMEY